MLALERRNLILEKLQTEKRVVVSELSQLYEVSEETIRRDLDKLEKEGLATKSYGGAVINEDVGIDLPFNVRKNQNVQGKQKMAEIAAACYIEAASLTSILNRMEEKGMIERRMLNGNRRSFYIFMTPFGKELQEEVANSFTMLEEEAFLKYSTMLFLH